jgi:hypothetical protein
LEKEREESRRKDDSKESIRKCLGELKSISKRLSRFSKLDIRDKPMKINAKIEESKSPIPDHLVLEGV